MDLVDYVAVLRRRALFLLLGLLVGIGVSLWLTVRAPDEYVAVSRSFVNIPSSQNVTESLNGAQLAQNLIATYAQIATSLSTARDVVDQLHLSETPADIQSEISAGAVPSTLILAIQVTDPDPRRAASIADATALILSDRVNQLERGKSDPVRSQLIDRAQVPTHPTSPKPRTNLAIGIVVGLLGGVIVAFVREALDRTIKDTATLEKVYGAPQLAIVPRHHTGRNPLVVAADPSHPAAEAFRSLRTAVTFVDPDEPLRTILVTSATPGEGKSTTVANLAITMARSGQRVAVVDGDLRRASLVRLFQLEAAVGVTSVVIRTATLDEALQEWEPRLQVLPTGPLPPNPSEILGSQRMADLLSDLVSRVDVVLLDVPPVLPVTDAVVLSPNVDAVIVVARHGQTNRHAAEEARRRLEAVGARVVGAVLNAVPSRESRGYYASYYYSYAAPRRPRLPRRNKADKGNVQEPLSTSGAQSR